jgi:hypothetical protein
MLHNRIVVAGYSLPRFSYDLIRIDSFEILFTRPICGHPDGQPHGRTIGQIDGFVHC